MMRKIFFIALPVAAAMILGACGSAAVLAPVETVEVEAIDVDADVEADVSRPKSHRVRSGETLIQIALNYGLGYRDLAAWNNIVDVNSIYEGELLVLSPSSDIPRPRSRPVIQNKAPVIVGIAPPVVEVVPSASASPPVKDTSGLPVKEKPLAADYPYAAGTLAKLQKGANAAPDNVVAVPPPAPALPVPSASTADKPAILLAQRRRFGVDWSWPSAGEVIEKFSDSNKGINIAGKLGTPVYAGAAGKVVYVGTGVKSFGRLVIIKHENDYLSAYAHNQTILVAEGDKVGRGQQISTLGDSGAPMPMLHFEVRKAGKPFDPLRVLPQL